MRLKISSVLLFLLLSASAPVLVVGVAVAAETVGTEQLSLQQYLYWQQINQARMHPYSVLQRLGISRTQAHEALGGDAWVLYFGLPPLAWSDSLCRVANAHGSDMIDRLYYSYITPEGDSPADRVEQSGYEAHTVCEALGLFALGSYLPYERAVTTMMDNLLRDELTGAAGANRIVFSPAVTEVGIALFAETLERVSGRPDIYLLVMDAARPSLQRSTVVGQLDEGCSVVLYNLESGVAHDVAIYPGGWFQFSPPSEGVELVQFDAAGREIFQADYFQGDSPVPVYLDLRQNVTVDENRVL
ncbi:MAG: hypothetical protein JXR59_07950 [Desulfuromonadaceae bacterium]|nr:hypothetical protein [Desulfuromonadaceae bacterium]